MHSGILEAGTIPVIPLFDDLTVITCEHRQTTLGKIMSSAAWASLCFQKRMFAGEGGAGY